MPGPALEVGDVGLDLGEHGHAADEVSHRRFVEMVVAEDQIGPEAFGTNDGGSPAGVIGCIVCGWGGS